MPGIDVCGIELLFILLSWLALPLRFYFFIRGLVAARRGEGLAETLLGAVLLTWQLLRWFPVFR